MLGSGQPRTGAMSFQGFTGHRGPQDMYMESGYGGEDRPAAGPSIAHQQQV